MNDIVRSGRKVEIQSKTASAEAAQQFAGYADSCAPLGDGGHVKIDFDPNGPYEAKLNDGSRARVKVIDKGDGADSRIVYDPAAWPNRSTPGTPSDVILAHEMNHARNNALGEGMGALEDPDPEWNKAWTNHEEANTVGAENAYREQRGGVPQREDYRELP